MELRDLWEAEAERWARWARAPGHDSYWRFGREAFFELLPEAGRRTLDVGCGEGRVSRDLKARGHTTVGVDVSPTLVRLAREADPEGEYLLADAAALPLEDGSFDLAVAFMSLQDIDDMAGAVREVARVLEGGGRFCFAVVHPLNSAGEFADGGDAESPFVIAGSYLEPHDYSIRVERDGLEMTFHSRHYSLEGYLRTLEAAGLLVEALREPVPAGEPWPRAARWQRIPLFLYGRALKP